jgi:hypothetical protein
MGPPHHAQIRSQADLAGGVGRAETGAPDEDRSKATMPKLRQVLRSRQIKYLNNIVEQEHRAIKRLVRPVLGFKSFRSAAVTLAGIELIHMIRKGPLQMTGELCPARQFYSLAG